MRFCVASRSAGPAGFELAAHRLAEADLLDPAFDFRGWQGILGVDEF
jgi:hypothetical protein